MKSPISRRALLTGGPLGLAACGTMDGAYSGKTDPPSTQRPVYLIGSEGGSLDPGKVTGGYERLIVACIIRRSHQSFIPPRRNLSRRWPRIMT